MFTGFPEETVRFFLDLRFHNQISYFEEASGGLSSGCAGSIL